MQALRSLLTAATGWGRTPSRRVLRRRAGDWRTRKPDPFASELIDELPASVVIVDAHDFRLLRVNRHATKEFHLPQALIGRTLPDAFGEQATLHVLPAMRRAIEQRAPVEHEMLWQGRTAQRVLQLRHQASFGGDGQ